RRPPAAGRRRLPPGGREERPPLGGDQLQALRQRLDGGAARPPPDVALEQADLLRAEPGPLGQLLLRQAAEAAVPLQQRPEGRAAVAPFPVHTIVAPFGLGGRAIVSVCISPYLDRVVGGVLEFGGARS